MKFKFVFTPNDTNVPINNQGEINRYIHTVLGHNNIYHDSPSDYCISNLQGGKLIPGTKLLNFDNGGFIIVSSYNDQKFMQTISAGIIDNPNLGWGMKFTSLETITEQFRNGWNDFATLSPVLIVEKSEVKSAWKNYLTLNSENFAEKLKDYLLKKLKILNERHNLNLDLSIFELKIPEHPCQKVKRVFVKTNLCFASQFRFNIKCSEKVAEYISANGIGFSCGSGFGSVYNRLNWKFFQTFPVHEL
jgi:CRISPR-associated endoribonuclease Cas6